MATHFIILAATALLFLLSHSPPPTNGDTTTGIGSEAVLDIEGNPLEANSQYYILPVIPGFNGGLMVSDGLCPLYVTASPSGLGSPVRFIPVGTPDDDRLGQIHLSSNVTIDSGYSPLCRNGLVWSVSMNPLLRQFLILVDGASYTTPALFKINKVDDSLVGVYNITHCRTPTACLYWGLLYVDFHGTYHWLLGLTASGNTALRVRFAKKIGNVAYTASN